MGIEGDADTGLYGQRSTIELAWLADNLDDPTGCTCDADLIFDLQHEIDEFVAGHAAKINPAAAFQWYPTSRLAADLERMRLAGLRLAPA